MGLTTAVFNGVGEDLNVNETFTTESKFTEFLVIDLLLALQRSLFTLVSAVALFHSTPCLSEIILLMTGAFTSKLLSILQLISLGKSSTDTFAIIGEFRIAEPS